MNAPQAILVVDDDVRLRQLLSEYLSEQGFFVAVADGAQQAREKLSWIAFDAMVLDRMMPGETGLELAETLKGKPMPILMLTAMGEAEDRIEGLEAGVRDYLTKPFEPRELVLRLRNLLGKATPTADVRFGPYRFEPATQQLWQGEEALYLTSTEAAMLAQLAGQRGEPVSREALSALPGAEAGGRAVDVQINRLRKKLEPEPAKPIYIQTVRGAGYRLS